MKADSWILKQMEELLEERKHEHIDEITFISRGRGLLVELHDLRFTKEEVYQSLHERYMKYADSDEQKSDLLADLMDFVVGYCSPCNRIWDNDGESD